MKCPNCNFLPVFLGNTCPNCKEKITSTLQSVTSAQKDVSKKKRDNTDFFTKSITKIDIKNIQSLLDSLKKAKTSGEKFESYIKLVTFIEEISCKFDIDSIEEFEDIVNILERNTIDRVITFFNHIINGSNVARPDLINRIAEKKEELERLGEHYDELAESNKELLEIEKEINERHNNINVLNLYIDSLKQKQSDLEEIERLTVSLEESYIMRVSTFLHDAIPKVDELNASLVERLSEKQNILNQLLNKYNLLKNNNSELLTKDEEIKKISKSIDELNLYIDNLKEQKQKIDSNHIDDLLAETDDSANEIIALLKKYKNDLVGEVQRVSEILHNSIHIAGIHGNENDCVLNALKESLKYTESTLLDSKLLDNADSIAKSMNQIQKQMKEYDKLFKKYIS